MQGVSSFSNFTVIPEGAVLKIPRDLPLELAALMGCAVITGVGAVMNAAKVGPGSLVAVFGAGGVGVNVVQGAAMAGAKMIIAVDRYESRLNQAREFGAHFAHVLDEPRHFGRKRRPVVCTVVCTVDGRVVGRVVGLVDGLDGRENASR